MRKIITCIAALFAIQANAETTNGGYTGCSSEEYYELMLSSVSEKDTRTFEFLRENHVCFTIPEGLTYEMLENGFARVKIRVYAGDMSMDLFAPMEMIRK